MILKLCPWLKRTARLSAAVAVLVVEATAGAAHATNDSSPFNVYGRVQDSQGKPMEGVEVWASCGIGTLLRTGKTYTDGEGRYRLSFGPGVLRGRSRDVGSYGAGTQVATLFARKTGFFPADLGASGNLGMTDATNSLPEWTKTCAGVVQAGQPYRLDFVLAPAASLSGRLKVEKGFKLPAQPQLCLKGERLPPSSSVLACCDLNSEPAFRFDDIPVGYKWWFEMTWRDGDNWRTIKSLPLEVISPTNRVVALTVSGREIAVEQ